MTPFIGSSGWHLASAAASLARPSGPQHLHAHPGENIPPRHSCRQARPPLLPARDTPLIGSRLVIFVLLSSRLSSAALNTKHEYEGAAIAQGVQKVAEKLIVSYTKIKRRAGYLSGGGKEKAATGGRGGDGDVDHVADPGTESDWDLDLALTTVEYNKAKLERIRLMGTRCASRDTCVFGHYTQSFSFLLLSICSRNTPARFLFFLYYGDT